MRTLATMDFAPEDALVHIDARVRQAADGDLSADQEAASLGSTCLYAIYDPATGRCGAASAGSCGCSAGRSILLLQRALGTGSPQSCHVLPLREVCGVSRLMPVEGVDAPPCGGVAGQAAGKAGIAGQQRGAGDGAAVGLSLILSGSTPVTVWLHGGAFTNGSLEDYKAWHTGECAVNRLKRHRAVATRYDRLAVRYGATLPVAAINEWL